MDGNSALLQRVMDVSIDAQWGTSMLDGYSNNIIGVSGATTINCSGLLKINVVTGLHLVVD